MRKNTVAVVVVVLGLVAFAGYSNHLRSRAEAESARAEAAELRARGLAVAASASEARLAGELAAYRAAHPDAPPVAGQVRVVERLVFKPAPAQVACQPGAPVQVRVEEIQARTEAGNLTTSASAEVRVDGELLATVPLDAPRTVVLARPEVPPPLGWGVGVVALATTKGALVGPLLSFPVLDVWRLRFEAGALLAGGPGGLAGGAALTVRW